MSVLLTGSEGALGRFFRQELSNRRYDVIGVAREPLRGLVSGHVAKGDLRDPRLSRYLFDTFDFSTVIHCAAKWEGHNTSQQVADDNFTITKNLIDHLGSSCRQFIYISSSAVYGESPYGISKKRGEDAVKECSRKREISYTIWRPTHVVSPFEQYNPGSSHLFTDIYYRTCVLKQEIAEYSNLHWIEFTWGGEIARCVCEAINLDTARNGTFNIGCANRYGVGDAIYEIQRNAHKRGIISREPPDKEIMPIYSNYADGMKEQLNLSITMTLEETVDKFLETKEYYRRVFG